MNYKGSLTVRMGALLLGVLLVSGCGGTGKTSTTTTAAATTTAATPAPPTTIDPVDNLNPPGQLPVCKETETLSLVMTSSEYIEDYAYGVNALTTYLQDRMNVEVDFVLVPDMDAMTKSSMSRPPIDESMDAIFLTGTNRLDRYALAAYADKGVLMDLTELLQTRGHNLLEMMDAYQGAWQAITAPNGGIYALP